MHQVRVASIEGYAQVAESVGLDSSSMLVDAGFQPSLMSDPEMRISARACVQLLERSARTSGCDTFGFRMADMRRFTAIGPLTLLLDRVGTVGDAVMMLSRYRRHLNDLFNLSRDDQDGTSVVRIGLLPEFSETQSIDYTVGFVIRTLHDLSGGRWSPTMVHLTHKAPADIATVKRMLKAPVEFESSFNGFSCPVTALEMPLPNSNAEMAQHAETLLNLVPIGPEDAPVSDRTKRIIAMLLPRGGATVEQAANIFGISARGLQRSLEQEGQTFAAILNGARKELATRYLSGSARSITDVAELTGYSSLSSFSRWFAREFGMSPHSWRSLRRKTEVMPARERELADTGNEAG